MDVLCTFKIKIEKLKSKYGCRKIQWSYLNQKNFKPQSGTSNILQSLKSGLKGHGFSLHVQNQERESQNLDHFCIKDKWPKKTLWLLNTVIQKNLWIHAEQVTLASIWIYYFWAKNYALFVNIRGAKCLWYFKSNFSLLRIHNFHAIVIKLT